MWELVFTKQAQKDAKRLASSGLKPKAGGSGDFEHVFRSTSNSKRLIIRSASTM
jgi:hypothetical protein